MNTRSWLLSVAIIMAATAGAQSNTTANLGALEMRPGPVLQLRDSGINENAAVLRRDSSKGTPSLHTATFEVTYIDFSPEAQAAFQAAVDIWSSLISSPVTIRIQATWTPLDGNLLGQAGSALFRAGILPDPDTFYPEPLADALFGSDIRPGEFDITAEFNSDHPNWYLGTDGNTPFGKTDFLTTVLHEIGHGLGFLGLADVEEGVGSWGDSGFPSIYDHFTEDGSGNAIIDTSVYPNPSAALAAVLQGQSLYWRGAQAVTVNLGVRPRLWAPSSWESGSSYSHLDELSYSAGNQNSLMTPQLGTGRSIRRKTCKIMLSGL